MKEFQLIEQLLAPLAGEGAPSFGLTDDAAVLTPPAGEALVLTKDLMVAGIHFANDESGMAVARKLLRVNLSDLAAMGARPIGYLVGFAGTDKLPGGWIESFVGGLAVDQELFGIGLLGGDTVSGSDTLVLSLTAIGSVPQDAALRRDGAQVGDGIFVSGTLGDSALGLKSLTGALVANDFLIERYRYPEPRLALGIALRGLARSCIDVSDGLIADMGHIAATSGCRAVLLSDDLPLSGPARALVADDPGLWSSVWSGGDDYELLFTASLDRAPEIAKMSDGLSLPISQVGFMAEGRGVELQDGEGNPIEVGAGGFEHKITG